MDNLELYKSNIIKVMNLATEEQIEAGLDWYTRAHRFARRLSKRYHVKFDVVCRVIAVLSPRLEWELNKIEAERVIVKYLAGQFWLDDSRAFGLNIEKAFDILDGNTDRLKGPKVTCFYDNIKNAHTSQHVTLDTHAWRVVNFDPNITFDNANIPTVAGREARQAFVEVAKQFELLPWQVQAITWLYWKAEYGSKQWQ